MPFSIFYNYMAVLHPPTLPEKTNYLPVARGVAGRAGGGGGGWKWRWKTQEKNHFHTQLPDIKEIQALC